MVFKSSEIRWFSKNRELLWNFYTDLPKKGEGIRESDRTDYYLRSGTVNTGIKIREGNHELKLKRDTDEKLEMGIMEHWIKWSRSEENNILNTIDHKFLDDWISVEKIRFKKSYEIKEDRLRLLSGEFVDEGCGAEFTELHLERLDQPLYTVGFEAFSASENQRANLLHSLRLLEVDLSVFKDLDSYGYPQLLCGLGEQDY